jgi:hypothetical protein
MLRYHTIYTGGSISPREGIEDHHPKFSGLVRRRSRTSPCTPTRLTPPSCYTHSCWTIALTNLAVPSSTMAIATAGKLLGLSVQQSYLRARDGSIPVVMVMGKRRVTLASMTELLGRWIEPDEIEAARLRVKAEVKARRTGARDSGSSISGGDDVEIGALIRRYSLLPGEPELAAVEEPALAEIDTPTVPPVADVKAALDAITRKLERPRWGVGRGKAPAPGQPVHPSTRAAQRRALRLALERRLGASVEAVANDGRKAKRGRAWRLSDGICPTGPAIKPGNIQ